MTQGRQAFSAPLVGGDKKQILGFHGYRFLSMGLIGLLGRL
jgi:hypothetical protein